MQECYYVSGLMFISVMKKYWKMATRNNPKVESLEKIMEHLKCYKCEAIPGQDPMELKGTGTIVLTGHIYFVRLAKQYASVDRQLENAQAQLLIKFWRNCPCHGFVPITRLDVAKVF